MTTTLIATAIAASWSLLVHDWLHYNADHREDNR